MASQRAVGRFSVWVERHPAVGRTHGGIEPNPEMPAESPISCPQHCFPHGIQYVRRWKPDRLPTLGGACRREIVRIHIRIGPSSDKYPAFGTLPKLPPSSGWHALNIDEETTDVQAVQW